MNVFAANELHVNLLLLFFFTAINLGYMMKYNEK